MTIFITKIIIIMIKIFQWQALHTKIKLLSFLLRSSRRTLIFSQASPIKVEINMYCILLPCMVSINGFHGYAPAEKSSYSPKPLPPRLKSASICTCTVVPWSLIETLYQYHHMVAMVMLKKKNPQILPSLTCKG